jgi:hypothetical protein
VRTALFWVITQRVVAISYRRFGTTNRSRLQGSRGLLTSEDGRKGGVTVEQDMNKFKTSTKPVFLMVDSWYSIITGLDMPVKIPRLGGRKISGLRSALFWLITQRTVVVPCRRFRTTYRSHLQGSRNLDFLTLEDGFQNVF